MFRTHYKWLITLAAAGCLSACQTVKIPDFEFMKSLADGFEEATNIGEAPEGRSASLAPEETRSAEAWDAQARALIAARDAKALPDADFVARTDAEIAQETAALKARVHAYKADDPVGGF